MPRYDEPTTIAEKITEALRANDSKMWYEWLDRVPSIVYPTGKDSDLLTKFQHAAKECGKTLQQDWNVTSEAEGYLYSTLAQDAAAVDCDMPEDQRVTCAEHRAWKTTHHLAKHHEAPPDQGITPRVIAPDPAFQIRVLDGHVSPETAYLVDDYPYGRRLRCKKRYWVETATAGPKRGEQRIATQTTNPKMAGAPWNKPHAGTYSTIQALFLDSEDHVGSWRASVYLSPAGDAEMRLMGIYGQLSEVNRRRYDALLRLSMRYTEPWEEFERSVTALASYIRENGQEPPIENGIFQSPTGRWYLQAPNVRLTLARQWAEMDLD